MRDDIITANNAAHYDSSIIMIFNGSNYNPYL